MNCPHKVLRTYSNHKIKPIVTVELQLKRKSSALTTSFEIVYLSPENVISVNTAESFGLIARVAKVVTVPAALPDVQQELAEFPELFCTTGTLPGTYTIKIKPNAKRTVHPPRRQPISWRTLDILQN